MVRNNLRMIAFALCLVAAQYSNAAAKDPASDSKGSFPDSKAIEGLSTAAATSSSRQRS